MIVFILLLGKGVGRNPGVVVRFSVVVGQRRRVLLVRRRLAGYAGPLARLIRCASGAPPAEVDGGEGEEDAGDSADTDAGEGAGAERGGDGGWVGPVEGVDGADVGVGHGVSEVGLREGEVVALVVDGEVGFLQEDAADGVLGVVLRAADGEVAAQLPGGWGVDVVVECRVG